tara:strand:- start:116 stop:559 length:444 start_codon:yes stop_codon:yes gene_type:complete
MTKAEKKLVDEIKKGLVLITNSNGKQTYGIAGADIELLEQLADERGAHDKYQDEVAMRFNVKFGTAQTVQAKGESKRKDTLSLDEKRAAAEKLVETMFTAKESEATKAKRVQKESKNVWVQLREAQKAGNTELVESLQAQLDELMDI